MSYPEFFEPAFEKFGVTHGEEILLDNHISLIIDGLLRCVCWRSAAAVVLAKGLIAGILLKSLFRGPARDGLHGAVSRLPDLQSQKAAKLLHTGRGALEGVDRRLVVWNRIGNYVHGGVFPFNGIAL